MTCIVKWEGGRKSIPMPHQDSQHHQRGMMIVVTEQEEEEEEDDRMKEGERVFGH